MRFSIGNITLRYSSYTPFAGGLLIGKYERDEDGRAVGPDGARADKVEENLAVVDIGLTDAQHDQITTARRSGVRQKMSERIQIPRGLGTGKVDDRESCIEMVSRALEAGYRHVDTAQGYENEAYIGTALERAGLERDSVVLGRKVLQHNLSYDDVHETVQRSLDQLGVDSVDILYVHWPTHDYNTEKTLAAFDELYERGVASHLGVCNFTYRDLEHARGILEAPLSVFKIEYHPLFRPTGLVDYCKRHGISVVGYSPLANGRALEHPTVQAIANDWDHTPAQVCLAWALAHDVTPIPRGSGDHIEENLEATGLALTPAEINRIDDIETTARVYNPDWAPWN